jgi:hypothetical protein
MAQPKSSPVPVRRGKPEEEIFSDVVRLIEDSRKKAFQAVNTTLIELYWRIGETISRKIAAAEWGDGVVEELARFIARKQPGLRVLHELTRSE